MIFVKIKNSLADISQTSPDVIDEIKKLARGKRLTRGMLKPGLIILT